MDEQTSPPFVDWEYELITIEGAWDDGFRPRSARDKYPPPGSGWHIEFRGRTLGGELLLANYFPSDGEDAGELLPAFESGSIPPLPVSIDSYFGPQDEPQEPLDETEDDSAHPGADLVDVEHTIYIGHGLAKWYENVLIITIPPEVFRDAALSILLNLRSRYTVIDERVFCIFAAIDPDSYERFLYTVDDIHSFSRLDAKRTTRNRRKATLAHCELTYAEMIAVLKQKDGIVEFRQLSSYIDVQDRTVRRWMCESKVVDETRKSLRGATFTSDEIRTKLLPWLIDNIDCDQASEFMRDLLRAGVISR